MSQKGGDFDPPNKNNFNNPPPSQSHYPPNAQYPMPPGGGGGQHQMPPNQMYGMPQNGMAPNPWEWWNNPYSYGGAPMPTPQNMFADPNYRDEASQKRYNTFTWLSNLNHFFYLTICNLAHISFIKT